MWSYRAWRRRRILARSPYTTQHWHSVRARLPILDGLSEAEEQRLFQRAVLFLHHKHLTALPGVVLDDTDRLTLAAQAELPLLHLADLDWYQGPVILAWPGVQSSGGWDAYNLVIHELAHKLDMLNGDANGLPPLHRDMRIDAWAQAMQKAYDQMNAELETDPEAQTAIDPYAAENPAEFFAVTSEYFFSAPDLLQQAFPAVYAQLAAFYRQDPLARLQGLQQNHPAYRDTTNG